LPTLARFSCIPAYKSIGYPVYVALAKYHPEKAVSICLFIQHILYKMWFCDVSLFRFCCHKCSDCSLSRSSQHWNL